MDNFSVIIPTYKRPENLYDQVQCVLDFEPQPVKVLITHVVTDKWTPKFPFDKITSHKKVRVKKFHDDPGMVTTKFTPAWDDLPTDFVFTVDDDIIPAQKFPEQVLSSYQKQSGFYGCMGFRYSATEFNHKVHGGWRGFPHDSYIHENKIRKVDSCGQGYFFNTTDFPKVSDSHFPNHWCDYCSDDLRMAYHAYQHDVECFMAPEPDNKPEVWPVKDLQECNLSKQSLVGGKHPDTEHKNELVQEIQEKNYTLAKERAH